MDPARLRVAAVIIRGDRVLMVRERGPDKEGRHLGQEYWTLPGGGIEPGESSDHAVRREVREEVGLKATDVTYLYDFPYPSGWTSCYRVQVETGEPTLGQDLDLDCECPRMVGLDWMPLGVLGDTGRAVPVMFLAGQIEATD
jgi:8-oxo-dGTP diphosphatase